MLPNYSIFGLNISYFDFDILIDFLHFLCNYLPISFNSIINAVSNIHKR